VHRRVRFHVFLGEDLTQGALRQVGQARMSLRRSVLAGVVGEKPRRLQFVGVANVLGFPAGQRHQPRLGFKRDRRLLTGPRAVVERGIGPSTTARSTQRWMV
jgi:hypothetical protein